MKFLNLSLISFATICSIVFLYAFSTLLDIFPWGDSSSYADWDTLLSNTYIPIFVVIGLLVILLSFISDKYKAIRVTGFYFIGIGLLSGLPSAVLFEEPSNIIGRWLGIVIPTFSICILIRYGIKLFKTKLVK